MSHIVTGTVTVTDLEALRRALARISPRLELMEGQKTHRWYGRFLGDTKGIEGVDSKLYGTCQHAIRLNGKPDAYEVGLLQLPGRDGYSLVVDNWSGGYGICELVGRNCEKIAEAYQIERLYTTYGLTHLIEETVTDEGIVVEMTERW